MKYLLTLSLSTLFAATPAFAESGTVSLSSVRAMASSSQRSSYLQTAPKADPRCAKQQKTPSFYAAKCPRRAR